MSESDVRRLAGQLYDKLHGDSDAAYKRGYHKGHHDGINAGIEAQDAFRRERDAAVEMARGYRALLRDCPCPVKGCDSGTIYEDAGGWHEPESRVAGKCPWCEAFDELESKDIPERSKEPESMAADEPIF